MNEHMFQILMIGLEAIVIPGLGAVFLWIVLIGNRLVRVETMLGNGIAKTIEKIELKCPACNSAIVALDTRLMLIEKRVEQVEVINHRLDKMEQQPRCLSELERIRETVSTLIRE